MKSEQNVKKRKEVKQKKVKQIVSRMEQIWRVWLRNKGTSVRFIFYQFLICDLRVCFTAHVFTFTKALESYDVWNENVTDQGRPVKQFTCNLIN